MNKKPILTRTLISLAILALGTSQNAQASLSLSTAPAGTGSIEPAPNIVVSVDDSGSMGSDGIKSLKDALKETFSEKNIPDNRVRLAWQSMNRCPGIPSNSTACNNKNTMKPLSGEHRTNFMTWVNGLSANGWTPSFPLVRGVGEYLRKTGIDSAWNKNPGTADNKQIACRKSYHIFMTDGEWNGANGADPGSDGDRSELSRILRSDSANIDKTLFTFPDGKIYDPESKQTLVYRDDWGFKDITAFNRTRKNNNKSWGDWTSYTDSDGMNTLADLAFYDWSTDLQPGIPNNMVPVIKKSGIETFGTGNSKIDLQEYWNPKNNPATWQNLVTYSIGFKGADTLTRPTSSAPSFDNDAIIDEATHAGEFSKLVTGEKFWPTPFCGTDGNKPCESIFENDNETLQKNFFDSPYDRNAYNDTIISRGRMYELWHMAINGRGKFMAAKDSTQLAGAFQNILNQIVLDTTKPITSFAATSSSVVSSSAHLYRAGYDANKWKGQVESFTIAKGTGAGSANTGWGSATDTTATKLDASSVTASNRKIYTAKSDTGTVIPFEWNSLHTSQQDLLKKTGETTSTAAQNRLNFIRGERSLEGDTTDKPFRIRGSRHGDIVNSAIWYVGSPTAGFNIAGYSKFTADNKARTPMLYVGANDGMLHGFSATDGTEKIAYIPQGLIKKLRALTDPAYTHQYYVDGSPFSGDVQISSTSWKTMLVGTLGAGGKGYFVLDVTTPGSATNLVYTDITDSSDADVGHIFGAPVVAEFNEARALQIARMNNDRWALITGNGYNSTNGRPVLMIQYLSGIDKNIKKITAASTGTESTDNGLSTPRPVDLNGDGMIDVVYAGDLKGNVWKFDVSNKSDSSWGVSFSSSNCTACTPFFTAKDAGGSRQPITSAPIVRTSKLAKGLMVAFGSGQNLTDGDRSDRSSVQSFYSMLDNTQYEIESSGSNKGAAKAKTDPAPTTVAGRSDLVARNFDSSGISGQGDSTGQKFWKMSASQTQLTYSGDNKKRGWYLDLPAGGERVLTGPAFYDGSGLLSIMSEVPASGGNVAEESCSPPTLEGKKFQTIMSIELGLAPSVQLLDINGDGAYELAPDKDGGGNRWEPPTGKSIKGKGGFKNIDGVKNPKSGNIMPTPPLTINWRQLQ